MSYMAERVVGTGSFGVVYQVMWIELSTYERRCVVLWCPNVVCGVG